MFFTAFSLLARKKNFPPRLGMRTVLLALLLTVPCMAAAQSATGAEKQAEKRAERHAERQLEKQLSRKVERQIERSTEHRVQHEAEKKLTRPPREVPTPALERASEKSALKSERANGQARQRLDSLEEQAVAQGKYTNEQAVDKIYHEIERDINGAYRIRNQWLAIVDRHMLKTLEKQGLPILSQTPLNTQNQVLLEIAGSPNDVSKELQRTLQNQQADFNHLYVNQSADSQADTNSKVDEIWIPQEAAAINGAATHAVAIGLIDSDINLQHETISEADIEFRSFIEQGLEAPKEHGTAIASILVGDSQSYRGVLPKNELLAAGVFYRTPELGQAASVKSLVLALDWMLVANIKVINMSLAGPPNLLVEQMIKRAQENKVVIVAAAGNNGPVATPAYPAAYPSVVAVTAVNKKMHAWHRANRGAYIDISAPGVNIFHADTHERFTTSSGTSYAAPFVSAAFAQLLTMFSAGDARQFILDNALDLGDAGSDEIYGRGFIHLPKDTSLTAKNESP